MPLRRRSTCVSAGRFSIKWGGSTLLPCPGYRASAPSRNRGPPRVVAIHVKCSPNSGGRPRTSMTWLPTAPYRSDSVCGFCVRKRSREQDVVERIGFSGSRRGRTHWGRCRLPGLHVHNARRRRDVPRPLPRSLRWPGCTYRPNFNCAWGIGVQGLAGQPRSAARCTGPPGARSSTRRAGWQHY